MFRTIAERLSRGRSFRYRLPQTCGGCRIFITPEAGLRYWFPALELRGNALLRNAAETVRPGSIVWDVGANMGLFTFAAAGLARSGGRVFAVEPDPVMASLLRRSAQLNPRAAPVEVLGCAVSDAVALDRFHIARSSRAANFLEGFGSRVTGGIRETQTVITVSLDWLAEKIPPPDVLKIDVEGAEYKVFRGAMKMLKARRPVILFESLIVQEWEAVAGMLRELGYALYDGDLPPGERRPVTAPPDNAIAIP